MRDPNRIKPFLDRFARVWMANPDLRFGQICEIICCVDAQREGVPQLFYIEDDRFIKELEKYFFGEK